MRIIVFMTTKREFPVHPALLAVKAPPLPIRRYARSFRWIFCTAVYGLAAVSTHATLAPSASQAHPQTLAAVTSTLSVLHGMEAFYPALGLLAAVASTYILRRRRLAQLEAIATTEH